MTLCFGSLHCNGGSFALGIAMDLVLLELGTSFVLQPRSVVGLLWLQTHFEPSAWDLICSGSVRLSAATRQQLCGDAEAAGLRLSCLCQPIASES